jgi:LDH2 family malate/lactate/ureidoglycolate dehydrogenase
MLPGDIERMTRSERLRDGIPLDPETVRQLSEVGTRHGRPFPEALV